jgi:hypothetical protein
VQPGALLRLLRHGPQVPAVQVLASGVRQDAGDPDAEQLRQGRRRRWPVVLRQPLPPGQRACGRAVLRVAAARRHAPVQQDGPRHRERQVRARQGRRRVRLGEWMRPGAQLRAAVPQQRRGRVAGGVEKAGTQ